MTGDLPDAPATRPEQFQFLRDAHDGPLIWKGFCLRLAREAAQLPAVHPSALAAAHATPAAHRVREVSGLRRGMVAYFDDPRDGNPFAHVATVAGWDGGKVTDSLDDVLMWSNDAARTGGVDMVRGSFFPEKWGDAFMFGATSLNGFDLPGYNNGAPRLASLAGALDRAIADLRRAIREHRAAGHHRLVAALSRDLDEVKQTRDRFR